MAMRPLPPASRLLFLGLLGLASPLLRADELSFSNRTDLLHQSVTGPNKAASFYDPGSHLLHETDVRWSGVAFQGNWNAVFNGRFVKQMRPRKSAWGM